MLVQMYTAEIGLASELHSSAGGKTCQANPPEMAIPLEFNHNWTSLPKNGKMAFVKVEINGGAFHRYLR